MKQLILLSAFIMIQSLCQAQPRTYHVAGTIKGNWNGKIFMFFENDFKRKDSLSSEIVNGKFQFSGASRIPILARFHMGATSFIGDIYLDGPNTEFTCTDSMVITNNGSDTLNRFTIQQVTGSHLQDLITEFKNGLPNDSTPQFNEIYFNRLHDLIMKYPELLIGPHLVSESEFLQYTQLDSLKDLIDTSLHQSYEYQVLLNVIDHVKKTSKMVDSSFHNVLLKDVNMHDVSTKQYFNKYTLVVFWASWCIPCRNEHADLNNIYSLYKMKGLTILGIALDKEAPIWKSAIKYDKLDWPQTIDIDAFDGEISKYYSINFIPYNILIDSKGVIIAKNLSIPEIYSLFAKYFK